MGAESTREGESEADGTNGFEVDSVGISWGLFSAAGGWPSFSEQASQYRFSPPISNRFGRITRHVRHC